MNIWDLPHEHANSPEETIGLLNFLPSSPDSDMEHGQHIQTQQYQHLNIAPSESHSHLTSSFRSSSGSSYVSTTSEMSHLGWWSNGDEENPERGQGVHSQHTHQQRLYQQNQGGQQQHDSPPQSQYINPNQLGVSPHNNTSTRPTRTHLSIDPRLFQSREHTPEDGDEDLLATAKPKPAAKQKSQSKKQAKFAEDRKKISHARKQTPDHIPRPRNAFILFRKHVVDSKLIPASVEMRHQNVSIITAKMWSEALPEQKAQFNELARIEKEEHMKKYPGYRYQPVYRRTNVIRRRVRKDAAEEEKCRSVAELLLKGKSGQALENEIKEKIEKVAELPAPKKTKLPSRQVGASELSKGALRALRAQARQQSSTPSVDWSDVSVSASRAASIEADSQSIPSRRESMMMDMTSGDMPYVSEPKYFQDDGMMFSQDGNHWAFSQDGSGQGFFSQSSLNDQHIMSGPHQTYAYPQPHAPRPLPTELPPAPGYYTYDQALPFSPLSRSFQHQHQDLIPSSMTLDPVSQGNELLLSAPYPSPGLYGGSLRVPMSARWDRNQLLPPSSEVRLDGLGFDDSELLLQDFGAALAQADDMGGVW